MNHERMTNRTVRWCRSSAAVVTGGVLLAFSANAGTEQVEASASECMAMISEINHGRIYLKKADGSGKKTKMKGVDLKMPLCVVDFGRREVRIRLSGGKGEWWLKMKDVQKPELVEPIRCGKKGTVSNDEAGGGTRGIGEEPCK